MTRRRILINVRDAISCQLLERRKLRLKLFRGNIPRIYGGERRVLSRSGDHIPPQSVLFYWAERCQIYVAGDPSTYIPRAWENPPVSPSLFLSSFYSVWSQRVSKIPKWEDPVRFVTEWQIFDRFCLIWCRVTDLRGPIARSFLVVGVGIAPLYTEYLKSLTMPR